MTIPLGRLKTDVLMNARKVLDRLQESLIESGKLQNNTDTMNQLIINRKLQLMQDQSDLSNEFYQILPFGGFNLTQLPVIENQKLLDEFAEMLENLLEYEIAARIVVGAEYRRLQDGTNPFDYIYSILECRLQLIDDNNHKQFILQYINNSSPSTNVKAIYRFDSNRQDDAFVGNHIDNHRLLWHGTKPENLLSILKVGLLAAPTTAMRTGLLYGKVK